jgi:hypothetical protein
MQTSPPPLDPPTAAEYAIGFESLRYITQLEAARAGSGAALARELGLAARPLQRFLAGADPAPEVWSALTDYARRTKGAKPLASVGTLGLAVTAAALPERLRKEARVRVAYALLSLYAERGQRAPAWLSEVLDLWDE